MGWKQEVITIDPEGHNHRDEVIRRLQLKFTNLEQFELRFESLCEDVAGEMGGRVVWSGGSAVFVFVPYLGDEMVLRMAMGLGWRSDHPSRGGNVQEAQA